MNRTLVVAVFAVTFPETSHVLAADPAAAKPCEGHLDAHTVVSCALSVSPEVKQARDELAAVSGRRTTAGVWLPSNPVVAATLSHRSQPPPDEVTAVNWEVTLSQELEIAGQRGARVAIADAEAGAQARRVAVAEQEVAASVLRAFFEAAAAQESLAFARDLAQSARVLASFAEARAAESLLPGIEADVAAAEATRIGAVQFEAERRVSDGLGVLSVLLGRDGARLDVPGLAEVAPETPPSTDAAVVEERALALRGEIAAAEMERKVLEKRLSLVRRARIPNVTLSAFVARDEIDDRILGVGLSVPLPLPSPIGQSRAGEIQETIAEIRAAESSVTLVRRRVRLEAAAAVASYKSRLASAQLFRRDLLQRARADLGSLRDALSGKQLSLREALAWQRSLIELLQLDIETRLALANASVELRRVAGLPPVAGKGDVR